MRLCEIRKTVAMLAEQAMEIAIELDALKRELRHRSPISRAPRSSARVTPLLKAAIIQHHALYPMDSYATIGRAHNVNPGRVSEIIRGKRK